MVDSISVSLADCLADELKRDWRNEWRATAKAPIAHSSAVTDTNDVVNVSQVTAALHAIDLWITLWIVQRGARAAAEERAENAGKTAAECHA